VAKLKITITVPTQVETLEHTPNPGIILLRSRQGGGTHRTRKGDAKHDRRNWRRQMDD
jgi:hypothetical protein